MAQERNLAVFQMLRSFILFYTQRISVCCSTNQDGFVIIFYYVVIGYIFRNLFCFLLHCYRLIALDKLCSYFDMFVKLISA